MYKILGCLILVYAGMLAQSHDHWFSLAASVVWLFMSWSFNVLITEGRQS